MVLVLGFCGEEDGEVKEFEQQSSGSEVGLISALILTAPTDDWILISAYICIYI